MLLSYNWAQVLEACDCLKLLSIHFDLCVDATGVVCHQLGLLGTDLHAVGINGAINVISKAEVCDCSAPSADCALMIFSGVCHDPFQKYVEEGGWE